jgi:hypothetical protein
MEVEDPLPCSQEPPLVRILSHMNPVHTTQSYVSQTYFYIILPRRLGVPSRVFPSGFPTKIPTCIPLFPHACYMLFWFILIDLIILIIFNEKYKLMKLFKSKSYKVTETR